MTIPVLFFVVVEGATPAAALATAAQDAATLYGQPPAWATVGARLTRWRVPAHYPLPPRQAALAQRESPVYARAWAYLEDGMAVGRLVPGGPVAVVRVPDAIERVIEGTKRPDPSAPSGWRRITWEQSRRMPRWLLAGWV